MMDLRNIPILATAMAAAILAAPTAQAASVVVPNASFEDADISSQVVAVPTGWSRDGANGGMADRVQSTLGDQHIWANGSGAGGPTTFYITLTEAITAGTTYTLTVDVFQTDNFTGSQASIWLFGSDAGFGTALAETTGIAPPQNGTLFDQTVMFTATAGQATGQTIGIALGATTGTQVRFDNVRLDAIPEPSSFALLGLGGLALVLRRRRV